MLADVLLVETASGPPDVDDIDSTVEVSDAIVDRMLYFWGERDGVELWW